MSGGSSRKHHRSSNMPGASLTVDTSLPPSTRRPWLGATALGVAVVAACWLGAILYWRASGSTPSGMAMAQLLVALPAGVLLSVWMGKSALSARAGTVTAPAQSAAATAAEARKLLPSIVAAAVRMRASESVAELAETLRTNAAPCALDPELLDDAGYPVLSGRAACADPDAAREAMAPWLAQRGLAELDFSDEGWRALSMAAAVTAELAQHALLHPKVQAWLPEYLAATKAERADHALPMLQLLPVLPANWHAGQRQAAADWLLHLVAQQGWPVERLRLSPGFTAGTGAGAAGFALLDTLALASGLSLLLACDSSIGDDSVRELGQRGLLFSGKTGRGQVPGEAACALLLLDSEQAARLATETLVAIDGTSSGRRPSSADAGGSIGGNIGASLLAGLVSEALAESEVDPAAIASICADADFRPNRMGELMSMASTLFPDLILEAAMVGVGAGCGTTGAAGTLAALALAAHEALACSAPALCVSNSDSHYRCALLVRPAKSLSQ
jgi:hypothetical protein